MGNKRYDKLQASFEASQPQLPTDFTHRVMKRVQSKSHRAIRMRRVMIAAAGGRWRVFGRLRHR